MADEGIERSARRALEILEGVRSELERLQGLLGEERSEGVSDELAALQEDLEHVRWEVADLQREIEAALDLPDLPEGRDRLRTAVLEEARSRLGSRIVTRLQSVIGWVGDLEERVKDLVGRVGSRAGHGLAAAGGAVQSAFRSLWAQLRRAASYVWSLVRRLLTLKEWMVGGTLGSNVWGFASTKVELTFGGSGGGAPAPSTVP